LGLPPDVAKEKVAELQASLFALTSRAYSINLDLNGNGVTLPPNYGGGSGGNNGGGNDRAIGVSGLDGFPSAPGAGVSTTNVYINTVMVEDGTDFLSMLAAMKQSSARNSASARAGSAYIGT
jgi:hypothetical protein